MKRSAPSPRWMKSSTIIIWTLNALLLLLSALANAERRSKKCDQAHAVRAMGRMR